LKFIGSKCLTQKFLYSPNSSENGLPVRAQGDLYFNKLVSKKPETKYNLRLGRRSFNNKLFSKAMHFTKCPEDGLGSQIFWKTVFAAPANRKKDFQPAFHRRNRGLERFMYQAEEL
jgi:hypothetical protein